MTHGGGAMCCGCSDVASPPGALGATYGSARNQEAVLLIAYSPSWPGSALPGPLVS